MATRKPLFLSTDYSPEEMAASDDVVMGKIVLTGVGGIAIDGGGFLASNFGNPVAGDDLATKAYVDAIASGLDVHSSVRVKTDADLVSYVAVGAGVGKTLEAPTDTVAANTIDGVLLTTAVGGDRVLVTMQGGDDVTDDIDNGIYRVVALGDGAGTKFKLERTTDADTGSGTELHQGTYVFVTEGTLYTSTGWTMVTADPITVDTTAIKFSQFSGAPSFTYDQGLKKVISSIQVDLDATADAQGVGAAGGSSGLEFDADTAAGKLRAAVNATGGLERSATGLAVKIDDTPDTLDSGAAGLKVTGVPNLFKVGGTATSQTPGAGVVTATNLNTLTAGPSSNADSLHTHASAAATEAPLVETDWTCGTGGVTRGDPVYVNTVNNEVLKGNTDTDVKAAVIGVASATAIATAPVAVDSAGIAPAVITGLGFTAGQRLYLATGGGLSTAAPGAAQKVVEIGFAKNATDLFVRVIDRGRKAA